MEWPLAAPPHHLFFFFFLFGNQCVSYYPALQCLAARRSRSDGRRHVGSAHRTKSKASFEAEFHTLRLPLTAPRPRPPACRRRTHSPGVQLRAPGTPDFPGGAGGIPPCVSGGWGWGRGRGGGRRFPAAAANSRPPAPLPPDATPAVSAEPAPDAAR